MSNRFGDAQGTLAVIIISSSDEKLAKAKSLGADHIINYDTTPEWDAEVLRLTNNTGVDNIIELVGPKTTAKSFNCVRWGGQINAIGVLSGKTDLKDKEHTTINASVLMKNVRVNPVINGPRDRLIEMLEFCKGREIRPIVDSVLQFKQAKEALDYLWEGKHFGKVVVSMRAK